MAPKDGARICWNFNRDNLTGDKVLCSCISNGSSIDISFKHATKCIQVANGIERLPQELFNFRKLASCVLITVPGTANGCKSLVGSRFLPIRRRFILSLQ